jgi:DNA-directed RNA polymerase alpha subunit
MIVKLNRYTADGVINSIRQIALTRLNSLRPIAFAVGESSNVINISEKCEEDMTEFIGNISSMAFSYTGGNKLVTWKNLCRDVLNASAFSNGEIGVISYDVTEVLHVFTPMNVTVYFRFDSGKHTKEDNEAFLKKNGVNTDSLVIINSRHGVVKNFVVNKLEEDASDNVSYDVNVITEGTISAEEVVSQAISILKRDLENFAV